MARTKANQAKMDARRTYSEQRRHTHKVGDRVYVDSGKRRLGERGTVIEVLSLPQQEVAPSLARYCVRWDRDGAEEDLNASAFTGLPAYVVDAVRDARQAA